MNCPRCNAKVAFTKKVCSNCGQNLENYHRIVSLSNIHYNRGLEKAKVRDLSGAIGSLKLSLEFNKLNTNARNLLGLIYFEVGEVVAALSQWVMSKHYQEENNDADVYIRAVQANPNRLDLYNQTIRRYNGALYSAQHGDEDMAIIQLKKVVSLNPKYIRAAQLLALLYMATGKKENRVHAKKLLLNIQKTDITNTTTIQYLNELKDVSVKGDKAVNAAAQQKTPEVRKTLPRADVEPYKTITPYKEEKPSIIPFVNIIIGVVVGMLLMGFLIMPHINAKKAQEANTDFKKYSEDKAAADSDVSTLTAQNEKLQEELEKLKEENTELKGGEGKTGTTLQENYENLIAAVEAYLNQEEDKAAERLVKISSDTLSDESAQKLYKTLKKKTFAKASQKCFEEGRDAYNGEGEYAGKRDYDKAITLLEEALSYDKNNTDAMYFLGRCYQQKSEAEKAKEYYNTILEQYPDSARVSEAQSRLRELGQ